MTHEIDPTGLLRAENEALRRELAKAKDMLSQLVARCRAQDAVIDTAAEHMTYALEAHGGSLVVTKGMREAARQRVVHGYHVETLEDDRERLYTLTPEEFEESKRKQAAVDEAQRQGGVDPEAGAGPKILRP